MNTQLTFNTSTFTPVVHNGHIYFSATDLAMMLEYKSSKSVTNLYNANSDEFTNDMTQVIESVTSGNYTKSTRIFSLRGAHLIAMFARTPVAKSCRKWILDLIEKEYHQPKQLALPEPITYHMTIDEVIALAWLWRVAENCRDLLEMLYPALEKIGSSYAGTARGYATEYVRTIEVARQVIAKITADLTDRDHYNAYVLNGLRKHKVYQPKP